MSNPIIDLSQYGENRNTGSPPEKTPREGDKEHPSLAIVSDPAAETQSEQGFKKRWAKVATICFSVFFVVLAFIGLSTFGNDNYYTIRKGENAYSVANKFNVPINILLKLNEVTAPSELYEGLRIKIPSVHDVHTVKPGDTLYSIALQYGIKRYDLAKYNRMNGSQILEKGDRIYIPGVLSAIQISASTKTGMVPFNARFAVDTDTRNRIRSYLWDLGDGTTSTKRQPSKRYEQKGDYYVTLTVVDENGNAITSNTIHVVARKLAHISFNARSFFVQNVGDVISLQTEVIDNLNNRIEFDYLTDLDQDPKLLSQIGTTDEFEVIRAGYSKITFNVAGKYEHVANFFVSPVESKHVPEPDVEWYKTQFRTGNNGNCGPSCIAMAIYWATETDVDVSYIRKLIGMPYEEGKIGFGHMINIFNRYKVSYEYETVRSPDDIRRIIDEGKIAVILLDTGEITQTTQGDDVRFNFFGRYYKDTVGHYIIIKGYSLNGKYFIVYDPIPSDWYRNRLRYGDGESMIGKNRYYSVQEIMNAIKVKTHTFLSISQE